MEYGIIDSLVKERIERLGFDVSKSKKEFRHFVVAGDGTRNLNGANQLWFLIDDVEGIEVSSANGDYNLANFASDEMEHIHTEQITIRNLTGNPIQVKFLQVFLNK